MLLMASVSVLPGQVLLDVAIQHLGSEEGVYALASLNKLSVTDDLTAGQVLQLPDVVDQRAVHYFFEGGHKPAVGSDVALLQGIGYWAIFIDFEVD